LTYEDRIHQDRSEMSKSFARLADFLLDSYVEAAFMTANELAHALDLDSATVVRFSQHLGYKGYPALQHDIREKVKHELLIWGREFEAGDSTSKFASKSLEEISIAIDRSRLSLDTSIIENILEHLGSAQRIFLLGDDAAYSAVHLLGATLQAADFPAYIFPPNPQDIAHLTSIITPQDFLLAFQVNAEGSYIAVALQETQTKGIHSAVITASPSFKSTRFAEFILTSFSRGNPGLGLVLVSALAQCLAETVRGKYSERFDLYKKAIETTFSQIQKF